MTITKDFIIPATVAETGEKVMVDNVGADLDNPWGILLRNVAQHRRWQGVSR